MGWLGKQGLLDFCVASFLNYDTELTFFESQVRMVRVTRRRSYGGVYKMPRKTLKKKQMRPIGYEIPRRESRINYVKRRPLQTIPQQVIDQLLKPKFKKTSKKEITRINLAQAKPAREGSVYEYVKSVKTILYQILHDAKRPDKLESETYDLLVLMAKEIETTLPSLKRDLGIETNNDNTDVNTNSNANNAEDIFEHVEEVYDILNDQLRLYSKALHSGNMNRIEQSEMLLLNIAVTLDGAIQEAKEQLIAESPSNSELENLLVMMGALKPFSK